MRVSAAAREPTLVQLREADAGEGAGDRKGPVDPTREVQGASRCGERLVESSQLRQRSRHPVEAELGQAELGRAHQRIRRRGRGVELGRRSEERHRVPVLAQVPVNLAQPEVRFHRELTITELVRQRERPLAGRDRPRQVSGDPRVIADVRRDTSQPESIVERLSEPLTLPQMVRQIRKTAQRVQALPQIDAKVEIAVQRVAARRKAPQHRQALLEAGDGLLMRGTRGRLTACRMEVRHRLVPHLALPIMRGERQRVGGQVVPVQLLQALGDAPVERHPDRGRQLFGGDLSNPVVAELESLPRAAQDAVADQLFHALGGLTLR